MSFNKHARSKHMDFLMLHAEDLAEDIEFTVGECHEYLLVKAALRFGQSFAGVSCHILDYWYTEAIVDWQG